MRLSKTMTFFLITCLAVVACLWLYYAQRYQHINQTHLSHAKQQASNQLSYSVREYANIQDQLFSIIHLLAHSQSTCDYAFSPTPTNQRLLEEAFSSVAHYQKWYHSITFVDNQGQAKVGVVYQPAVHAAARLSDQDFTTTSDVAWLAIAEALADDEIAIWGLDNQDTTPTMHLITPVMVFGLRYGYLVMEVDLWRLVERMRYSLHSDLQPEIITSHGVLISHALAQFSLQKPFSLSVSVSESFPNTWQAMQSDGIGYHMENQHLLVFTRMTLPAEQPLYLLINLTPQELAIRAERDLNDLIKEALFILLMVVLFALPILSMFLHYYRRSIESKLARAALNGMTAVMIADKNHHVMMVNREFERLTGLVKTQLIGQHGLKTILLPQGIALLSDVLHVINKEHNWQGELELSHAHHNQTATVMIRIQGIMEAGHLSYYITSIVDITERKRLENQLRELSEKDSLTQLWNRRKFEIELNQQALQQAKTDSSTCCLVLLDIDFFKRVNDEQGHDQGDRVIMLVAKLLMTHFREQDFIARIGGEEFAVIMPETSVQQAQWISEQLRVAVANNDQLSVTISAGITDLSQDATQSYKYADMALYKAKRAGRNQISTLLIDRLHKQGCADE